MPETDIVVDEHKAWWRLQLARPLLFFFGAGERRTARENEERVCELDVGEPSHVPKVDGVGEEAEGRQGEGNPVNDINEQLESDDEVNKAHKNSLCDDGMLFDDLGQIIETRS